MVVVAVDNNAALQIQGPWLNSELRLLSMQSLVHLKFIYILALIFSSPCDFLLGSCSHCPKNCSSCRSTGYTKLPLDVSVYAL